MIMNMVMLLCIPKSIRVNVNLVQNIHFLKNMPITNEILVGMILLLQFRQKANGHVTVQLTLTLVF